MEGDSGRDSLQKGKKGKRGNMRQYCIGRVTGVGFGKCTLYNTCHENTSMQETAWKLGRKGGQNLPGFVLLWIGGPPPPTPPPRRRKARFRTLNLGAGWMTSGKLSLSGAFSFRIFSFFNISCSPFLFYINNPLSLYSYWNNCKIRESTNLLSQDIKINSENFFKTKLWDPYLFVLKVFKTFIS